ncbi:UDP-glucuronate 4-epimerase 6 [Vitis vinifera]|uniref:UDP-glucuronate 4-epimerase 6 n=1 Tax=Vitis vinifera TaxID=29760 RepID=A0A438CKQ7_VITVI|nr:UDP-glucuronate 4-epimerase 6 [Vitis vinifera]
MASPPDTSKTTKLERYNSYIRRVNSTKLMAASSKLLFRATLLVALVLIFFFTLNYPPLSDNPHHVHTHQNFFSSAFYGSGASWEKQVRHSSTPRRPQRVFRPRHWGRRLRWHPLLPRSQKAGRWGPRPR